MLVCNSIDTICFTIDLDPETQAYLVDLQFSHSKLPKWLHLTPCGIVRYRYGLESDGISIYYSDSLNLTPNCYIRFSSEVIQREGYDKVYQRLCSILHSFGVSRPGRKLKLSQVDLCFDFQADFSKYLDDSENYSVQTKLKDSSDRRIRGNIMYRLFGIGTSVGYKVRCYDKLHESNTVAGKLYWHEIWEQSGFALDEPIWRVEYEIRRDFLKQWRINSFYAFQRAQQSIQKRLFSLWNIKVLDDSNKSRCSFVPEFEFLIEHFTADFHKHFVDKRPEEFSRAAKLKMSCAVSALLAAAINFGAHAKITDIDADLNHFRLLAVNNVLHAFSNYSANKEAFVSDVNEALCRRGYYFAPGGGVHSVPDPSSYHEANV